MDQLDQVLADLRREYEPDQEAPKRVRALLGVSLVGAGQLGAAGAQTAASQAAGSGAAGSSTASSGALGAGSVAPGPLVGAVTTHSAWLTTTALKGTLVALAVGGAAAVGVQFRADGAHQAERVRPAPVVQQTAVVQQQVPVPTLPAEDAHPQETEHAQEHPADLPRTAPPLPPAAREANAPVRRGHTLEELQLLSAASHALRAGQLEEAQRALETHRARYPSSALARERSGLSLELQCTRGATAAVRAEAERFVHADETSPISSAVQKKCLD